MSDPATDRQETRRGQVMRRCFMNGKRCIFPKETQQADPQQSTSVKTAFVAMPYRPNMETFYRWTLRPFLVDTLGVQDPPFKADEVQNVGYIVCERICRRIQEATFVAAEVTYPNPNVFYELGLALGLRRPVILFALEDPRQPDLSIDHPAVRQSLNMVNQERRVLRYHGLKSLLDEHQGAKEGQQKPADDSQQPQKAPKNYMDYTITFPEAQNVLDREGVVVLRTVGSRPLESKKDGSSLNDKDADIREDRASPSEKDDIPLDAHELLRGAVSAALGRLWKKAGEERESGEERASLPGNLERESPSQARYEEWKRVVRGGGIIWESFSAVRTVGVDGSSSTQDLINAVESAFCTVIDVTPGDGGEHLAYFWLGYCHGRGLNVVPVFRQKTATERGDPRDLAVRGEASLAFDIRALWYAEFKVNRHKGAEEFQARMEGILELLFERDLPERQKRAFWERIPVESELCIFTGAIHTRQQNREMVGDWDVRTVSWLLSYLPNSHQTKLMPPMYSPEYAYRATRGEVKTASDDELLRIEPKSEEEKGKLRRFLDDFRKQLATSLSHSAIVIASPETNAVTEYVLHKIYGVSQKPFEDPASHKKTIKGLEPFDIIASDDKDKGNSYFRGYVVVKSTSGEGNRTGEEKKRFAQRVFYEEIDPADTDPSKTGTPCDQGGTKRGYREMYDGKKIIDELRDYNDQHECNKDFQLLGHLVVAQFPEKKKVNSNDWVVVLNGISGPATCAMAQILAGTGRDASPSAARDPNLQYHKEHEDPESIIEKLNSTLKKHPDAVGVEAIIEFTVGPVEDSAAGASQGGAGGKSRLADPRAVKAWKLLDCRSIPDTIGKRKAESEEDTSAPSEKM